MGAESVLIPEKASEDEEPQSHQRERQKNDLGKGVTTQSTLGKNNRKRETEAQPLKLTIHLSNTYTHMQTHSHGTQVYKHSHKHILS